MKIQCARSPLCTKPKGHIGACKRTKITVIDIAPKYPAQSPDSQFIDLVLTLGFGRSAALLHKAREASKAIVL